MEYTPRYPQPFTLAEAVNLDVSVISEEIARLQNSLVHLRSTQEELKEANEESPDVEFETAMKENEDVIGSQEERISLLRMALAEKGYLGDSHGAGLPLPREDSALAHAVRLLLPAADTAVNDSHEPVPADEDGGIDL